MLLTNQEIEQRRIAELGRPTLGEHVKLEVTIEESYQFKVSSQNDGQTDRRTDGLTD